MPRSNRRLWIVFGVLALGVAVSVVLIQHTVRTPTAGAPSGGQPWRAESDTLVQRVEKLSAAGEVDAATSVLDVLLQRADLAATGQGDRARMAVARACLTSGRRDQALAQVLAIPWADKGPQIAADIVGLELAVRWRGLFDEQMELVSGALPPAISREAPFGRPEGLWQDRWNQYRALATALDRGVRMVAAEGGQVAMPGSAKLLTLARYSRGDGTLATLMAALGDPAQWQPDLALSLMRLHLSEHDPESAFTAAEVLWSRHAETPQAGLAFRDLRLWQLRRQAMTTSLRLWAYPEIDQRLDALVATYAAMAASAETSFRQEREINQVAMTAGVTAVVEQAKKIAPDVTTSEVTVEGLVMVDQLVDTISQSQWRLAVDYDGLSLRAEQAAFAAGSPVRLRLVSEHRGEHQVRIYRLAGRAAWDELIRAPTRAQLPTAAVAEQTIDLNDWTSIGNHRNHPLSFPDLAEGFYIATVSARGCPVVIMTGMTVVDPDLHLIAGRTELLAWVVRRSTGHGKAGEPISATVTLERHAQRAAGTAWSTADPAWRSGFTEGFTGIASPDFKRADQHEMFAQGVRAGSAAAAQDPALSVEVRGISDAQGLVRLALPERLHGRAYHVHARIARPEVAVERTASFGEDAAWTNKAVVWADKPLARPGETLRFKVLLRDFNGDGYRLPVGELRTRVRLDNEVLHEATLAVSDHGTISGEVLIPPGATDGLVTVVLGAGSPHHLARVERVRLPPVRFEISGLDTGHHVRAGESLPLTLRLRDRGGEPLAGIVVKCGLTAHVAGEQIPCEAVADLTSDLAGEVCFTVPTAAGVEANYQAAITFVYDGITYHAGHDWRTRTFPFQLEATLRERDLRVGGVAQVELRLPIGAEVALQFTRGGAPVGAPLSAKGRWPAWTQVAIGIDERHVGAEALTISTAVLGGGTATRKLSLKVEARLASDGVAQVDLRPVRNRVETGEALPFALGVSDPGRDLLVLGGARDLVLAQVERLDQSAKQSEVVVAGTWAPNLFLSATAYLPGAGFVTSERREVEVLPIDRLLTVTVTPSRSDLRPGELVDAVVQVVDWRGQPAANCSLSLGVVNDLLYQLAEDPTPDLWRYFHSYRRPWGLVDGRISDLALPHAMFWRSVISRWQGGGAFMAIGSGGSGAGMFGSRMGMGRTRAMMARVLLQPEADGTIWWVADLRTDAQGKAMVRFPLPEHAGRFRCTARANDGSAAVLVGEVRSVIASREPYACALDLPDVVAPGDVVPAQIQVANHEDQAATLVLSLPDGATRELVLGPKSRRTLTLPVTIPTSELPATEVVRLGSLLGERLSLRITVTTPTAGDRVVSATATTLRRLPGHPHLRQLQLVADHDGLVRLPLAIQPSAGLWLRLRAWPDAATRRNTALADWRQLGSDHPPRSAMGWLLAESGAERRKQLATWWPRLGDDAASTLVKQAAIRRGEATTGINRVPEGAIGDWLLARGRAAGQSLPSPRLRGIVGTTLNDRVAFAATAIAEGWSEGPGLWQAARRELLEGGAGTVNDQALAIGCDAARLADDRASAKRLAALLGQREWTDDLVAVLACELLPEKSEVAVNQVVLSTGLAEQPDVVLPANAFSEWSGMVGEEMRLRTVPGALVHLELIVQQLTRRPAPGSVAVDLWQEVGDGYERLPVGQPLSPGRRVVLVMNNTDKHGRDVTVALPSLLRLGQSTGEVFLIDRREPHWTIGGDERGVILSHLADGEQQRAVAAFATTLTRLIAVPAPLGRRVGLKSDARKDASIHGGALLHAYVQSGECLVFPVETLGEGSCRWPGTQIDAGERSDRRLSVAAVAPTPAPAVLDGHPLRNVLVTTAERCTVSELHWLVSTSAQWNDQASWERGLRILDPTANQDLSDLQAHPLVQEPGHWTQRKIRRWVDGEPLLESDAIQLGFTTDLNPPTLSSLIDLAVASRDLRREAWLALPQPQPAPAAPLVNLKRWYERLQQLGVIDATDYRTWCWQQSLDHGDIERLGYAYTLDSWVAFIRQQLDLPLRIGSGVRAGSSVSTWVSLPQQEFTGQMVQRESRSGTDFGGVGLGSSGLGDGLVVVSLSDGYEVRPLQPSPQPKEAVISVDYTDVPAVEAFDHLNLLLSNRGLSPASLGKGITREQLAELPPITLRIADVPPYVVLDWFAKIQNLTLVRNRQGMVIERE